MLVVPRPILGLVSPHQLVLSLRLAQGHMGWLKAKMSIWINLFFRINSDLFKLNQINTINMPICQFVLNVNGLLAVPDSVLKYI